MKDKIKIGSKEINYALDASRRCGFESRYATEVVEWIMQVIPSFPARFGLREFEDVHWIDVLRLKTREEILEEKLTPLDVLYSRYSGIIENYGDETQAAQILMAQLKHTDAPILSEVAEMELVNYLVDKYRSELAEV